MDWFYHLLSTLLPGAPGRPARKSGYENYARDGYHQCQLPYVHLHRGLLYCCLESVLEGSEAAGPGFSARPLFGSAFFDEKNGWELRSGSSRLVFDRPIGLHQYSRNGWAPWSLQLGVPLRRKGATCVPQIDTEEPRSCTSESESLTH